MPELSLTDAQRRRVEAIRDELSAVFASRYATVRDEDVVAYLLDTYTPPDANAVPVVDEATSTSGAATDTEAATSEQVTESTTPTDSEESAPTASSEPAPEPTPVAATDAASGGGAARVSSMLRLLEDHDSKWRESSSGETPYEVELPDGSTEPARTRDDVRRILYQHY